MPDVLFSGLRSSAARPMMDDTFALLHEIGPATAPRLDVQPITEGQFRAIVQGFDAAETPEGVVYTRDGHPWRYLQSGDRVTITHCLYALPARHYVIV